MCTPCGHSGIPLTRRVRKLQNQHVIWRLISLAVPSLPALLRRRRLRPLLQHVLSLRQDVACCTVLDRLEGIGVRCPPVSDGKRIALDRLDRSPDGVRGVAGCVGVIRILGIKRRLCG